MCLHFIPFRGWENSVHILSIRRKYVEADSLNLHLLKVHLSKRRNMFSAQNYRREKKWHSLCDFFTSDYKSWVNGKCTSCFNHFICVWWAKTYIYVHFLQPSSTYPSALIWKPPDIPVLSIHAEFCLHEPQVVCNFKTVLAVRWCVRVLQYQDSNNS